MTSERLQKLEAVFHHVRRLPRAEWPAALREACGDDESLRCEVKLLLEAEPATRGLHLTEMLQEYVLDESEDEQVGRRIGPYELGERLGIGGMATVYLARQREPVERTVALKLIKRGMDTDDTVRRFRRERQVLAALTHPHIAQLLDGGSTPEGLPYFVMEYVDGQPITHYCDERGLSFEQRIELFCVVCEAVHFAHRSGVVHRDLKPPNILVTKDGAPKLLDFGLAKVVHVSGETADQTIVERQILTPDYASPEQVLGRAATERSDVYSLGVVLLELLTGQRPWELRGRSTLEMQRLMLSPQAAPAASELACRAIKRPDRGSSSAGVRAPQGDATKRRLRGDIDNIIARCLQKEASRRYASVLEIADDLRRHLRHEPVRAAADTWGYRLRKFVRRNRAACAIVLVLSLGLVGTGVGALAALRSRDVARRAGDEALKEKTIADAARQQAESASIKFQRATAIRDLSLAQLDLKQSAMMTLEHRLSSVPPSLRSWDHAYLRARSDDTIAQWQTSKAPVLAMALDGSGRQLAVAEGPAIVIRDTRDGTILGTFPGQADITSLDFDSAGGRVLAARTDGSVEVWTTANGERKTVRLGSSGVPSVRFSPDGTRIAAGLPDRTIRLLDAETLQEARRLEGYAGVHDSLCFSGDSRKLFAGGGESGLRCWSLESGAALFQSRGRHQPAVCTALSHDGRQLAWGSAGMTDPIQVIDSSTGRVLREMRSPDGVRLTRRLAFSARDQRLYASWAEELAVLAWTLDQQSATPYRAFHRPLFEIGAMVVSPEGNRIYAGGPEGWIFAWDPRVVTDDAKLPLHGGDRCLLAASPDGRLLLIASPNGLLGAWDTEAADGYSSTKGPKIQLMALASRGMAVHSRSGAAGVTFNFIVPLQGGGSGACPHIRAECDA